MKQKDNTLNSIQDIRNIMEKSTKFSSLSGLSFIAAGIVATISALFAAYTLDSNILTFNLYKPISIEQLYKLIGNGIITLILASVVAYIFTKIKAAKLKHSLNSVISRHLFLHLAIPLLTGGIIVLSLIYHGNLVLVAPLLLISYGLGVVSASKFTHAEIFYLGIIHLVLGCIGLFALGNGLILWTLGFGLTHIIWGIYFYKKHD